MSGYISIPLEISKFQGAVPDEIVAKLQEHSIRYKNLNSKNEHSIKVKELVDSKYKWNISDRKIERHRLGLIENFAPTSVRITGGCPFDKKADGSPVNVSVLVSYPPHHFQQDGEKVVSASYAI